MCICLCSKSVYVWKTLRLDDQKYAKGRINISWYFHRLRSFCCFVQIWIFIECHAPQWDREKMSHTNKSIRYIGKTNAKNSNHAAYEIYRLVWSPLTKPNNNITAMHKTCKIQLSTQKCCIFIGAEVQTVIHQKRGMIIIIIMPKCS